MQKTSYQTPELRDENDSIIQEGSFGKNTALSNATNDGWIDYVMNNLEALHDTIGDSAPTLDGNGHVVEPANLAIGDEDGLRIKNNYLKLSGGTVNGTLNIAQSLKMQDNQENVFGGLYVPGTTATLQYLQLYGGETPSSNGGNLQLLGNGQFTLQAKNGATAYNLVGGTDGTLKWRNNELAWKKDYLPLTGGTMTGGIGVNRSGNNADFSSIITATYKDIQFTDGTNRVVTIRVTKDTTNSVNTIQLGTHSYGGNDAPVGISVSRASNGTVTTYTPTPPSEDNSTQIANTKFVHDNYFPLNGGTMTGKVNFSVNGAISRSVDSENLTITGGTTGGKGAQLILNGKDASSAGVFNLQAHNGTTATNLQGYPGGSLSWGGNQLGLKDNSNQTITLLSSESYTITFKREIVTIIIKRGSNCAIYVVDYWTADAIMIASAGNSASTFATVTHEQGSRSCTVTSNSSIAIAVQVLHSDIAW